MFNERFKNRKTVAKDLIGSRQVFILSLFKGRRNNNTPPYRPITGDAKSAIFSRNGMANNLTVSPHLARSGGAAGDAMRRFNEATTRNDMPSMTGNSKGMLSSGNCRSRPSNNVSAIMSDSNKRSTIGDPRRRSISPVNNGVMMNEGSGDGDFVFRPSRCQTASPFFTMDGQSKSSSSG